jgi:hypothetical protein
MQFRIADTFTESLARLTGDEQKSVKTTAFDLQLNPANPGPLHIGQPAREKLLDVSLRRLDPGYFRGDGVSSVLTWGSVRITRVSALRALPGTAPP